MALRAMSQPLSKLLDLVVNESGEYPGQERRREESFRGIQIPQDLIDAETHSLAYLWLTGEKALPRGKVVIDDALHLLRLALARHRLIPEQQKLFSRGYHYYIRQSHNPEVGSVGAQRGFEPFELGLANDSLELLRGRIAELEALLDKNKPPKLRDPLIRGLTWIGSSVTKAEAIAVRYILLGIAVDEATYVTHPLRIYDLYLLRNDIVHGSARRVCGEQDYEDLRYVALDTVDRLIKLIKQQPQLQRMSKLFDHIRTEAALTQVESFVSQYPANINSVKDVGLLVRTWLTEIRAKETTSQS